MALRRLFAAAILTLITGVLQVTPGLVSPVSAHGGGERNEVFRGREGSYLVIVGILPEKPVVGTVHISVTALEAETLLPVKDAIITVIALNEQGEPTFQAPALPEPNTFLYYDANITFDGAGAWSLLVDLKSNQLGEATVTLPLDIGTQPLLPGIEGTFVFLAIIAILVGGTVYVWYSARKRQNVARA